jgi:hypothetical protein
MAPGPHSQGSGSSRKREKLTLATLPSETLKTIFSYVSSSPPLLPRLQLLTSI